MALRINHNGTIEKLGISSRSYYNVNMIESAIGGFPEPIKKGSYWVILNSEENKVKNVDIINCIATEYFGYNIYGNVMIVTSKELPHDWDLIDDEIENLTIDEVEKSILVDLYNMNLISFNDNVDSFKLLSPNITDISHRGVPKVEFVYNPYKADDTNEKEISDYESFLIDSYDFIVETAEDDDMIVYEDSARVIKIENKDHKLKTIDQLIDIFLNEEEYEKCGILRDVKEKIK